ncbi:MAG: IPT/TIG domain-containing protein [Dehalococcoidia bacterium]|nr:IPT/TIG domain-containing protein [Dehalococcoidia bacterium]
MTSTSVQPRAYRWGLLVVALLALTLVLGDRVPAARAADGPITYGVDQYPEGDTPEPVVIQVGDEAAYDLTVWGPLPGGLTGPLTFTMKRPAHTSFARVGHEGEDLFTGCADNTPEAGFVRCTFNVPSIPEHQGWTIDKLYFRFEPSAAGTVYSNADIVALFTDPLSGIRDDDGTKLAETGSPAGPELGGLTVANILGPGANIDVATTVDPPAVLEGQLSTVTVAFSHEFSSSIGPTREPIEATVTNAEVQPGSVTCPGAGVISVVVNVVRCSGSSIADGSTMSFDVRAQDSGGANATIVITAPSLGLTIAEAGTAPEGTARGTLTITTEMNPVPVITSLTPPSIQAGAPGFTLTVKGTGFVPGSKVTWKGAVHATTYISATELRINLNESDIQTAGTISVGVVNPEPGGGIAVASTFTVTAAPGGGGEGGGGADNPLPLLTAISPTSAPAGSPDVTLTVTGTNFVDGSVVQWAGAPLATTYVSATKLTAIVPAAKLAAEGTAEISVVSPAPGGGPSVAKKTFTIGIPEFIESEELDGIEAEGFVARSRLTFAATTGNLAPESVSFVIQRESDGKYWNGETGAWQADEFENAASESAGRWEYSVTGAARRQFVSTTVSVSVHGAKAGQLYTAPEPIELHIR